MDVGEGTGGDQGPDRGQGGVPDLIPGVEGPDPGGDVTGRDHGPATGRENETETGIGTGTGTGEDIQHAEEQGWTTLVSSCNVCDI